MMPGVPDIDPMLDSYWSTINNAGPVLDQRPLVYCDMHPIVRQLQAKNSPIGTSQGGQFWCYFLHKYILEEYIFA